MANWIRYRQLAAVLAAAGLVIALAAAAHADANANATRGQQTRTRPSGRRTSQTRVVPGAHVEVNRPRSIFDCDTPRGEAWYGSADRCLRELCAGGNYTNRYIDDADDHLRKNPCYGRDPYELQR